MNYGYQKGKYGVGHYVKAASKDGVIDVLGCPYGGPLNDRDVHGEYFSKDTDFMPELIPYPPVFYHHGAEHQNHTKMVGNIISRWVDDQGVWYRVKLSLDNKDARYSSTQARRLWEKALKGLLYASSGAVPASVEKSEDGEIKKWLVGELSLFDLDLTENRFPANFYARARPTKSGYYAMTKAGRKLFGTTYVRGFRKKVQDVMGEEQFVNSLESIAFDVTEWIDSSTAANNAPNKESVIIYIRDKIRESVSASPQMVPTDSTAENVADKIVEAMVIEPSRMEDTEHVAHMIFVATSSVIPAISMPEDMEELDIPDGVEEVDGEESGGNDEARKDGMSNYASVMIGKELKPVVDDTKKFGIVVRKILKSMIVASTQDMEETEIDKLTEKVVASIEIDTIDVKNSDPDSIWVSFDDAVKNIIGARVIKSGGGQWPGGQDNEDIGATADRDSRGDDSSGTKSQAKEDGATSHDKTPNLGETEMSKKDTTSNGEVESTQSVLTAESVKSMVIEALGDEAVIGQFVSAFAGVINQGDDGPDGNDHKSGGDGENVDDQFVLDLIANGRLDEKSKDGLKDVFAQLRSMKSGKSVQSLRDILDINTRTDRYQVKGFKISDTDEGIDPEYMQRFSSYVNVKTKEGK